MNPDVLDESSYFDRAERSFLLEGKEEHRFSLRHRSQIENFYERLDKQLQAHSSFQISAYRSVKDGFVKVSRPAEILLTTEALLKKRPYLRHIRKMFMRLQGKTSAINIQDFANQNYRLFFDDIEQAATALEILNYMIENRFKITGLLPREIPHGSSTKYIGIQPVLLKMFEFYRQQHSSWRDFYDFFGLLDRPVEFRFFGSKMKIQGQDLRQLHGVLSSFWIQDYDFSSLKGTFIVENSQTFFSMAQKSLGSEFLLIDGGGWKAARLLNLFSSLPKPLFYWGDMDKEGYEIFGLLKRASPDLRPFLMNLETLNLHKKIWQRKDVYLGPYQIVPELQDAYELVCKEGLQVEQEQISIQFPSLV